MQIPRCAILIVLGLSSHLGSSRPQPPPEAGIDQRVGESVTLDSSFRDETGNPLTLREAAGGKPVILALVYYRCPQLCTLILNGLGEALQDLRPKVGEGFSVISLSFDPKEGPELARAKQRQYLKSYGRPAAERGWRFLTGEAGPIDRLCRETGYRTVADPLTGEIAHGSALVLLTPEGKISRYLLGISYPERELRLSLVEASEGKIGTVSDQILLLCMRYDPATGKYGLAILRLLKIAAVGTLLGMALLIYRLSRKSGRSA